ncbi:MAG: lipopolysaccharide heptosyltransferase II [Planctomycetota bacterium]
MSPIDPATLSSIVIRLPNWIGDAVMAQPAIAALRERLPRARITLLGRPWAGDLYADTNLADNFLPAGGRLGGTTRLRREKFDAGFLLPNSFSSALSVALAGVPRRIGYATDGRGWLLTHPIPGGRERIPEILRLLRVAVGAFDGKIPGTPPAPRLVVSPETREAARRLLGTSGGDPATTIGLAPFSHASGAKRWPLDRFRILGSRLASRPATRVVIVAGPAEKAPAAALAGAIGARVSPVADAKLPALAGLLAELDVLVANDTGPMHLAAAVGTPVVAIFGPTDPVRTAPVGDRHRILAKPPECAPCFHNECPENHRCMTGISMEEALAAVEDILARRAPPGKGAP